MNGVYLMIDYRGKAPSLDAYEDSPYFEPDDTYLPGFEEVALNAVEMWECEIVEESGEPGDECTDDGIQ